MELVFFRFLFLPTKFHLLSPTHFCISFVWWCLSFLLGDSRRPPLYHEQPNSCRRPQGRPPISNPNLSDGCEKQPCWHGHTTTFHGNVNNTCCIGSSGWTHCLLLTVPSRSGFQFQSRCYEDVAAAKTANQKENKAATLWRASFAVQEPLTWRQFHRMAVKGTTSNIFDCSFLLIHFCLR